MTENDSRDALILLGCPQVPVQTSMALYLVHNLAQRGIRPVIAGTPAARKLMEVADPGRHYLEEMTDIDAAIDEITEKRRDFDLCFVFIHNDSGVAYAGTMAYISEARVYALIFGEHAEDLAGEIEFPCEVVAAKATHNPMPLKRRLDEVMQWAVLRR
ncbi:MAG TPA: DUF1890 domain-containing protein [Methanoculleus sp.]|jgi:hypothetical protein|uniref:DUF1890 domain-containing protein n=1 Tax=Methanoculleus sp. TaxID=90427 RepID=UPI002CF2A0AF|nr:DUF1890 domain-containing protein [Methanoculleus sp.]HOC83713.1 DUF1890 domain-containing protein [Methanoculleus sp.]HOF96295.1 DUF1890 domain-containing protein [Methanoculleus sp.]HOS67048.1 DUF1890 domain-containing protein [Methanoculleus sp.]HOZ42104.1 DUF1890 domain-containing protein [Methanoculleus sp.]HPK81058.1 DUF1890 domain-containing protein [Methanoculleus sp.]